MRVSLRQLALILLWLLAPVAHAHKLSDAYLTIKSGSQATYSIAVRDLDAIIPELDADNDRDITWGEVKASLPAIINMLAEQLRFKCAAKLVDGAWKFSELTQRSDGNYLQFTRDSPCVNANDLQLSYQVMAEVDATHKVLVSVAQDGTPSLRVVTPTPSERFEPVVANALHAGLSTLLDFFTLGASHIALGVDHLLFLLALVLSFQRREQVWSLVACITAFTLGHGITIIGAVLQWFAPPAWVEPAIAASIGIAALINLFPGFERFRVSLALLFGLIHGLGFSGALNEARLDPGALPWALAGFNLGVEAGQLVFVALWVLLVAWVGKKAWFKRRALGVGSLSLCAISLVWSVARLLL